MKSCATGLSVRLSGDDSLPHPSHRQLNGQDLDLRAPGGKSQCGSRENRNKAPGRQQTGPHLGGIGDHSRARIIEPAGAKASITTDVITFPAVPTPTERSPTRQVRSCAAETMDFAHPPRRQISTSKRDSKSQSLVGNATEPTYNQKIDVTFHQFPVQCLHMSQSRDETRCGDSAARADRQRRSDARGRQGWRFRSALPTP